MERSCSSKSTRKTDILYLKTFFTQRLEFMLTHCHQCGKTYETDREYDKCLRCGAHFEMLETVYSQNENSADSSNEMLDEAQELEQADENMDENENEDDG